MNKYESKREKKKAGERKKIVLPLMTFTEVEDGCNPSHCSPPRRIENRRLMAFTSIELGHFSITPDRDARQPFSADIPQLLYLFCPYSAPIAQRLFRAF